MKRRRGENGVDKMPDDILLLLKDSAAYGVWDWDPVKKSATYDHQLHALIGDTELQETAGEPPLGDLVLPSEAAARQTLMDGCRNGDIDRYELNFRIRRRDDCVVWFRENAIVAKRDEQGRPTRVCALVQDVSRFRFPEETARAERERREYLAHLAGLGGWEWDWVTGIMRFDDDYRQLLGYDSSELDGHIDDVCRRVLHPEDIVRLKEYIETYDPNGIFSFKMRMRHRNGQYIWVHDIGNIVRWNKRKEPVLMRGGVLNIDKLVRAEEESKSLLEKMEQYNMRLKQEVERAVGNILTKDKLLRAVNSTGALLLGSEQEAFPEILRECLRLLGESVEADRAYVWRNETVDSVVCASEVCEWAHERASDYGGVSTVAIPYDDFIPNWRETLLMRRNVNCRRSEMPDAFRTFPGMQDVLSFMYLPIFLRGTFWGLIGFDNCTGDRRFSDAEQEIMNSGGMLIASAIIRHEANCRLVEAKESALMSMNAKTDFLSRMSHEIRTPMNAIIGMNAIAKKTDNLERIRRCLEKIDSSSHQLLSIINDVLDMSKIDANKLEIVDQEFDFEIMLKNAFNVIQVKVDEKHINFQYDFGSIVPRNMISDELRLSQVLINLLNNAVKFTPDEGTIRVKIRETATGPDSSLLRVEVADNGIGIEPDRLPHLFTSFEQADGSITRKYGGTGLGLAISKRIVELMGGRIWAESEPGQGATFIFEVEVGWGSPSRDALSLGDLPRDIRILVVDDLLDVLEYFRDILEEFSLSCDTAQNGPEAVRMVSEHLAQGAPYDLILLDWIMPGMNGRDTAVEIKRVMNDDIIVIMISVLDWSDIKSEATRIGIHNFLSKPVLPSDLYRLIARLTSRIAQEEIAEGGTVYDWSGRTILLAEDIEINRDIVSGLLEETGVVIEMAADGDEAVSMFLENGEHYDLILMDVQMPGTDGITATRRIRASAHPRAAEIPILAMTANAFKEDADACIEAGMNDHIAKPLDVDELFEKLGRYLNR